MTLWRLLFGCPCREMVRERLQGRLTLHCLDCGRIVPFGLQSCAPAPAEPSRAIPKPKRVQRPAVVRFPKVVNK
jgi:hypothetical protein